MLVMLGVRCDNTMKGAQSFNTKTTRRECVGETCEFNEPFVSYLSEEIDGDDCLRMLRVSYSKQCRVKFILELYQLTSVSIPNVLNIHHFFTSSSNLEAHLQKEQNSHC